MRRFLIGFAVVGILLIVISRLATPTPSPTPTATATNTPRPPTRTPRVPTITPAPVETEVREGIFFNTVTLTQPDLPSGQAVELPLVSQDGTAVYTYDGNMLTFAVVIGSNSDITFPLRVEVQDGETVLTSADLIASNTTEDSAELIWDTFNTAWDADGAATGQREIVVRLLDEANETLDSATFTVTVRPRPVVLVHGWNSTSGMWSDYVGYLDSAADGWIGLPADNLSTGGGGTTFHDAKWNSVKLNEFITAQREALEAQHIDLVGHSMGGLISRAYLQEFGAQDADGQPVALRLITLGTPNTGSPCGNIGTVLNVFTNKLNGAWHFTPKYMADFNATIKDTHGTLIHALAGENVWTCGVEGDGVVPVSSAQAYGTNNRKAPLTAHIPGVEIWERLFGANDFEYSEKQFNEYVAGQLRTVWIESRPLVMQAAPPEDTDAPPVTQHFTLTVPANSIAVMTISAFDGEDLGVMLAPVAGISAELRAPDGTVLATLDSEDMETLPMGILPHEDAPAGTYTVHLTNNSPTTATVEMVVFESSLNKTLEIEAVIQPDGQVLVTAALLQNGVPVPDAILTAHIDMTEGFSTPNTRILIDSEEGGVSSDGVYTALLDLPEGVYALAVKAESGSYDLTEVITIEVPAASADD